MKKICMLLITMVIVSFLAFLAFQVIPGDPAVSMLGTEATPARLAALRAEMGLNEPLLIRYFNWLKAFCTGNMGTSYSYRMPVSEMIVNKIPITLTLSLFSFIMIIAISIPVGIYSAKHQGGAIDRVITIINQIVMAFPAFFFGMILTFIFGLLLRWFQPGGYVSYTTNIFEFAGYLIVPAIAIALPKAAMTVKLLRSSLIKESKMDYVRTAYSRGNTVNGVIYRHILRNALIPVITFLAMTLADIIAGSLIIEQVFGIPGLGRMLITSISNRDYPVVQAIIVCIAFMVIVINFTVDIIYQMIDPRIRLQ